ncbi:MAG: GHMP kinase [Thermoplasmata archaeon]|nr:GHMP kinase [Thermoplasmata archaeon]
MSIRSKAPLRISFAGDGTDVPPYPQEYGGVALSAAIDKYTYGSLIPTKEKAINVTSLDYDVGQRYQTDKDLTYNGELDFVKASIKYMKAEQGMFDILIHSDAPPRCGLGSSSTEVVCIVGLLKTWQERPLTNYELAEFAYKIEREDLGILGGKQDQYVATFGGFNYIEFLDDKVIVNQLKIHQDVLNELQYNLLLCYTGKMKLSGNIIREQVKNYQKNIPVLEELKNIAYEMKNALLKGDLNNFGDMLHQCWEHKKQLAKHITNPQIDKLYDKARAKGALGGRISGAGGGGYLLLYCDSAKKHLVAQELERYGAKAEGFEFVNDGLQIWHGTDE